MKLSVINTGFFKLDGGAMFGVVPKSMWQKLNPADENNMCTWAMRCLLVETAGRKILIDTGLGNKQDEKFRSHFYPHGEDSLLDSLDHLAVLKEEISDVFITHFHFDHVGAAMSKDAQGHIFPTFPNAKYWTNELHYKWALNPNPREQASFLRENFVGLKDMGLLHFIDVEQGVEFLPDFNVEFAYGHTEAMMTPLLKVADKTIIFCADLLASPHHIGLPYVMAYDVRPLDTIKEKAVLLERAAEEKHILFFEHDPLIECATVRRNDKGRIVLDETFRLSDVLKPKIDEKT